MKRVGFLIDKMADADNLRLAFWKASKGKRHAAEVLRYAERLDQNLLILQKQIISGEVEVGNYRFFKIFEPKERQICASPIGEQVLHHALMNICHPVFERVQIFDSYASRKGKGQFAAIARAQYFSRQNEWFLKLDARKFFDSIHHETLKNQLDRLFKDARAVSIFHKIIDSFSASAGRGLPIGNLTSQYFANHYLAGVDHFIKETRGQKSYVRYMDDLVVWADEKAILKNELIEIAQFLDEKLLLSLKPVQINRVSVGLPFLGHSIFEWQMRLSQTSKQRFFRKMKQTETAFDSGEWSEKKCQSHAQAVLAFVGHADTRSLRTQFFS